MLNKSQEGNVVPLRQDEEELAPIQFIDLNAQQARIRDDVEARIKAVLDHGAYINGPEIADLEKALADWTGAADVVLCGNGTEALEIAMMGEGVGPGDAVFIPAFTYNATASAVLMVGATPVFVDVDETTFNIDPADLEAKVKAVLETGKLRPKMIVTVDLFGMPADYQPIGKIAQANDLSVLADGAQSFGGQQNNKRVGNIAPMTATSFFPAKTLGCYGDGGAIFSDTVERAEIWRSIRWHGTDESRKESVRIGTNGRMDSMQAAVVLAKLEIFDSELSRRTEIAAMYNELLGQKVQLPVPPRNTVSGWGLYSVLVEDRNRVQAVLKAAGIPTAIYYSQPLHEMTAFRDYAPEGGLPVCESLSQRILSLPMHPYLTDEQVRYIGETLAAAV